MGETEEFNPLNFEKRLTQLKDTQESIQGLSSWCLKQRQHHKKIVSSWLNVLKRVKVEQRLVLFYLANDVIQYSKRKNYEFVESWGLNLQKATPLVRDEKVRHKILRIFKIWEQRSVYDEEFLSDLTGLLSAGTKKSSDDDALDFQPQQLVNKIKQCTVLEADTDLRLKNIHENKLDFSDPENLCSNLKDRSVKDDVIKELNDGISCVERYTAALQREIVAREALLALLTSANQYYSTQRGEVKVVAYAYKNFGARVRALKRKLDELTPKLPEAVPSPPPRDEDVPSPAPDDDLELPQPEAPEDNDIAYNIDRTFNTSVAEDGSLYNLGLSSFLSSDNPLSLFDNSLDNVNSSANKIEVISSRPTEKPDFNVNDFFKTLVPNDSNMSNAAISDNNSVASATLSQKSQETLPGLDLLPSDIAPPSSFYGAIEIPDDPEPTYSDPGTPPQWNNNAWSMPTAPPSSTQHAVFVDTPASPPPALHSPAATRVYTAQTEPPPVDVDHRGILPPPPPPPVLPLLGHLEDVDHRLLPPPPVAPPSVRQPPPPHPDAGDVDQRLFPPPPPPNLAGVRQPLNNQDVDHRNLISLTQNMNQPLPPRPVAPPVDTLDQDYRVPTMVPPPDIVESVDMDLSEDEDTQGMFPTPATEQRRPSFNNKVLVGGNNGKTNHETHTNLIQINNRPFSEESKDRPMTAPVMPPLTNPFDKMPPMVNPPMVNPPMTNPPMTNQFDKMPPMNQFDKMPPMNQFDKMPPMNNPFDKMPSFNFDQSNNFDHQNSFEEFNDPQAYDEVQEMVDEFEEDIRSRNLHRSMSFENEPHMNQMNHRFPRNWGPRTNMRPQFGNPPFRPRNGPWPQNRWMGPRPTRFW